MRREASDHFYADRTILGARLKWWRARQGLTLENVASELGVSTSTWGHWETGHSFPSGALLLDLSEMTKLPLQILFCPNLEHCPLISPGGPCSDGIPCCQCSRGVPAGPVPE